MKTKKRLPASTYKVRCKGWRKENRKHNLKTVFYFLVAFYFAILVVVSANAVEEILYVAPAQASVNYESAVCIDKVDLTVKDEALAILDERGVSDEFVEKFECLVYYENRGWDPEATNPNIRTNGSISIDMGLIQWNSQTAPVKMTKACSYNINCTVNTFVDYIEDGGDWNRWFGYKYNCK